MALLQAAAAEGALEEVMEIASGLWLLILYDIRKDITFGFLSDWCICIFLQNILIFLYFLLVLFLPSFFVLSLYHTTFDVILQGSECFLPKCGSFVLVEKNKTKHYYYLSSYLLTLVFYNSLPGMQTMGTTKKRLIFLQGSAATLKGLPTNTKEYLNFNSSFLTIYSNLIKIQVIKRTSTNVS
ncbi:Protein of unknown function [Gryllus bimaculatus]|nr:Protein of unknown function [Gryllus bimaculatus]